MSRVNIVYHVITSYDVPKWQRGNSNFIGSAMFKPEILQIELMAACAVVTCAYPVKINAAIGA